MSNNWPVRCFESCRDVRQNCHGLTQSRKYAQQVPWAHTLMSRLARNFVDSVSGRLIVEPFAKMSIRPDQVILCGVFVVGTNGPGRRA